MYDAIVVGARCAGASTAMLLARKGYKVLLVDKATFPSDIPHGHFIHRDGPRRLKCWGLLDKVVASNCPPITTCTSDFGDFPLVARNLIVNGVAWGYGPRRSIFDKMLVDAAVEAGAELREGFTVEDFLRNGDQITGIRGRDNGRSALAAEQARITIGADGRNSRLAGAVGAPAHRQTPAILCYYFTYWSGIPSDGLEMYLRDRRMIFAHPTNYDLFVTFVGYPVEEFHQVRSDIEGKFMQAVDLVPELAERLRNGVREERFYGIRDLPNFFRKPYGPGWALVGDAGYHKGPFMALGMSDALRDAELLSEAIEENLQSAQLKPRPEVYQLRSALQGSPEDATRFWMARVGMIPREEFFNPETMQRIMAKAQR